MTPQDERQSQASAKRYLYAAAESQKPMRRKEPSWPIVRLFRWTLFLLRSWKQKRASQRNKPADK